VIQILVADGNTGLRRAVRRLLDFEKDMMIVGEAENFPDTVRLTQELRPDVVVLDCNMQASEAVPPSAIKQFFETVTSRLLGISVFEEGEPGQLAKSFGAKMLLDKVTLTAKLVSAIRLARASCTP